MPSTICTLQADVTALPWWEREKMLSPTDRAALDRAKPLPWTEIREDWAETPAGRYELHLLIGRKMHRDEAAVDMASGCGEDD